MDNSTHHDVPLNEPPIRMWELTGDSTHYDRMIAAPSDEEMVKFWIGWATIMFITGIVTLSVWLPLIFNSRQVRRNPFNLYLIYLLTPDMLVAWICGITCLRNAMAGHFTSVFACKFQSFYMVASIAANSWINLLVTRQLYHMLWAAQNFQTVPKPRPNRECLAVYVYALFLASLAMFDLPWWPHKTRLTIGSACIPMDYDTTSTIFFYCVFFPLLFGIPLAYVCWAAYQIYRQKLLPPSGSRRVLAIYFFRIAAVFLIMWLPGLLLLFVTSAWLDPWVQWTGGAWSHLQGLVSVVVSLWKPDVWESVKYFWKAGACFAKIDNADAAANNDNVVGSSKSWWSNISAPLRKPRWVTDSVYWSPRIQVGGEQSNRRGSGDQEIPPSSSNVVSPTETRSYISTYHEEDDDLEQAAKALSYLEGESNIFVSDDSEFQVFIDDRCRLESIAENKEPQHGIPQHLLSQDGLFPQPSLKSSDDETTIDSTNLSDLDLDRQSRTTEEFEDAPYKAIYIVPRNKE